MPLALLAALAASLITHATALFLPEGDWLPSSHEETPITLQGELQIPPSTTLSPPLTKKLVEKPSKPSKPVKHQRQPQAASAQATPAPPTPTGEESSTATAEPVASAAATEQPAPPPTAPPGNSAKGSLSYRVYKGTQGFEVGRSVHQWEVVEGRYTLVSITETSGLAGLFYPVRIELQSTGQFGPDGFIPERFRTLRQGKESNEDADFDWASNAVKLTRDGKTRPLTKGSQDLLSFPFQLAYRVRQLGSDESVFPMHVASGKRYDPFNFTVQGEETLETRAGIFRTLHLKATAPNNNADTTDVWLAIEHQSLAIKIRFTDRNGDSFEQVIDSLPTTHTTPTLEKP